MIGRVRVRYSLNDFIKRKNKIKIICTLKCSFFHVEENEMRLKKLPV